MENSNKILQGTTPVLIIEIDPDDLYLSDVVEFELTFKQLNKDVIIKYSANCDIDYENNKIEYHFTEEETLKLYPERPVDWQLRLKMRDGEIVGTVIDSFNVSDLISKGAMPT